MATRPTADDLVAWLGLSNPRTQVTAALTAVLETALDFIEARVDLPTDGAATPSVIYPSQVAQAVLLTASRLAKRASSPEGVSGFGDFGVVRVAVSDPDVETLLARFLKVDGFV